MQINNFNNFVQFFLLEYLSVDPCFNYNVLDNAWRATNRQSYTQTCDTSNIWSGWYRLFLYGLNVQISDTCVMKYRCGTDIPLWIRGGHPTVEDGVVTRDVCGHWGNYCCYYGSYPIKVKACPGNYYVYELVSPTICAAAYCAGDYICMSSLYTFMMFVSLFINLFSSKPLDVNSINTSSTAIMAVMFLTGNVTHCVSTGLFSDLLNVMICTTRCEWTCVSKLNVHSKIPGVKLTLLGVYMGPHYRVLKVILKQC